MTKREKQLVALLREVEARLRKDPFVILNAANFIDQELARIEGEKTSKEKS
jgi:hypothetical protein